MVMTFFVVGSETHVLQQLVQQAPLEQPLAQSD